MYTIIRKCLYDKLSIYKRQNIKPIIDYISKKDTYVTDKIEVFNLFPNNYHTLHPNMFNYDKNLLLELIYNANNNNCILLIDKQNDLLEENYNYIDFDHVYTTYEKNNMYRKILDDISTLKTTNKIYNVKIIQGKNVDKNEYKKSIETLIKLAEENPKNVNVIFATHNKRSIDIFKHLVLPNVHHAFLTGFETFIEKDFHNDEYKINKLIRIPCVQD